MEKENRCDEKDSISESLKLSSLRLESLKADKVEIEIWKTYCEIGAIVVGTGLLVFKAIYDTRKD